MRSKNYVLRITNYITNMKKSIYVLMIALIFCMNNTIKAQDKPAYLNTSLSFEQRAADLVSRMTLDEKILQMQNESPALPRLNIIQYDWWSEGLHGVARNGIATVFPQAIGMAATWDTDLIYKEADVISTEARAKHNEALMKGTINSCQGLTFWSPNINIFRDPRWGRGQETYGEDPYLTSRIGVSFVKGLQGNDPKYLKVVSTPKHYAVHSGPEPMRHTFDARVSKRDLYETYLTAFHDLIVEGGAYSIMGAYSSYDGVPCCASKLLLTDILRKKWGFKGYVVSDCGAVGDIAEGHKYAKSSESAAALAVKAGCDLTCGGEYVALKEAVKKGLITEKEIDVSLTRLMLARMKLGMFDPPSMVKYQNIPATANDTKESRDLARKVACESMVLLKNQNNLLPLDKSKIKSIAVIGPYIKRDDILYGNYNGISSKPVTFLDGIKNKLGDKVNISYTIGVNPYDEGGELATVPSENLKTPYGKEGLLGEYFDNPELTGKPVLSQIDKNMEFYWDKNSPGKGIPEDYFSVRWTGTITPPETGTYELGVTSDDRSRFYFDDTLKVNNWRPCEVNVMKSFKVKMEKGKEYKIRMEYADSVDWAGIRFRWKKINTDIELETNKALLVNAIKIAKTADVIIVFAGISANIEGEEMSLNLKCFKGGDRVCLDIPEEQLRIIKALKNLGKPIVLVLTSGSALSINWENDNIPAILQAWYPGEEGGNAVADVLFGDYNPAGRLPVTWYKSANDLPDFSNYNMKGRTYRYFNGKTLYPFGYGLSYTYFQYFDMKLSKDKISNKESVKVSVKVTNNGNRDGEEVVQLYVKNLTSKQPQPIKSLKGFKRIALKKGESKTIELTLKADDLKYFDETKDDFIIEAGDYEVQIGASSEDIKLKEILKVK